ncbi:Gfo/Idh/MocA family protein [Telmatospirillum sp. J64-1]|uniref:Gfo/Idh/MocA family protein n=1 Tax=Telmatospirillum sp. J64-1 TaxID=2502183 RepID=UPI00115E926A|nr:Gfo/Idh/MocA family oxidoreductase [Telmatospirillum sp. J64-1]
MTATDIPIAIVGLGKIGRDQHVPSIAAHPRFRLAATVSRHATMEEVPAYTDLSAMQAAHPEITAVALCTPPQVRYDLAREALEAGLDVLLEKPPGATVAEVEALARLARERGRVLFATWHSRFAQGVPAARDWLAGREILSGRITWREDVRRWHPGQTWIWQPGGLGVFDPGINALSILTEILPLPVRLTGAELEFPENQQAPIAARLSLRAGAAAIEADFDFRQTGPQTWDILLETDEGRLHLSGGGATVTAAGRDLAKGDALDSEYDGVYARFADLLARRESEVDVTPLMHVADAFMLGRRLTTDPFVE